jgi:hypothetical protein
MRTRGVEVGTGGVALAVYPVLIIEDCRNTGSLLLEYLSEAHVTRLVRDRRATDGVRMRHTARDDESGTPYKSANNEPGEGQLAHLRHVLLDVDGDMIPPEAKLYPTERAALDLLYNATRANERLERSRALKDVLRTYGDLTRMVLVADLALLPNEGKRMERAQAPKNGPHGSGPLRDPRKTLRTLTGFRIVEALRDEMPVIATTYSRSPLVAQHCLVSGAFAVVGKPVPQRDKNPLDKSQPMDMATARQRSIAQLEDNAKRNRHHLDVLVANYATTIVSEVLKAIASVHAMP